MKTLKKVIIEPVFVDGYMPKFETMEDGKIYISEEYMTSTHRCLCGCGTKTVLPLNKPDDNFGWNLIKEKDGTISLTPSILNPEMVLQIVPLSEIPPHLSSNPYIITKETYPSHHYIITKNVANFC